MTTRAVSPGGGWRWFRQAIDLGRSNPKAIFGAVALLVVVDGRLVAVVVTIPARLSR